MIHSYFFSLIFHAFGIIFYFCCLFRLNIINNIRVLTFILRIELLIFFIYPIPKGSEENQFPPFRAGALKLIFIHNLNIEKKNIFEINNSISGLLI